MKWANSWDIICLDVSNNQIFQGLWGFSLNLFTINTEKERKPSPNWIKIPSSPVIEQLSVLSLLSFMIIFISNSKAQSKADILLDLGARVVEENWMLIEIPVFMVLVFKQRFHIFIYRVNFVRMTFSLGVSLLNFYRFLTWWRRRILWRRRFNLIFQNSSLNFFFLSFDDFGQIRICQSTLFPVLEHQEKSIFNRVLIPSLNILGHLGPLFPKVQIKAN